MGFKDTMLIFDLDGTLWNSSVEVAESWNIILKKHHPERTGFTDKDIQSVMGKTMKEIADILLPDLPSEERIVLFDECQRFEVEYLTKTGGRLFPEVRATLEKLKAAGYKMGIVSNCQVGYIDSFLDSMDMREYFCDLEEWGRTLKPKSHNIRLLMERNGYDKAVYIGDTEKDRLACLDAEVPFIHAAYGFGTIDAEVTSINEFSELLDLFI